jgi:hypothetical protein
MLPRRSRALLVGLAGCLVAIGAVTTSALARNVPLSTSLPSVDAEDQASIVRRCLAAEGRLAALFLVDASRSIAKADPAAVRVDAIRRAIGRLSDQLSLDPTRQIEVMIATFGESFRNISGKWIDLRQEDSFNRVESSLEELRKATTDDFTRYDAALDGVERQFVERDIDLKNERTCKLLYWLSDGALDMDDDGRFGPAEEEAKDRVCLEDGLAARLRSQRIFTLAAGLSTGSAPKSDFDLMEAIVEGREPCGMEIGEPSPHGLFVLIDDAERLNEVIDHIFPPPPPPPPCSGRSSDSTCRELVVDAQPPTKMIRVSVGTQGAIDSITVAPPGAEPVVVFNGAIIQTKTPAISVAPSGQGLRLQVDAALTPGAWTIRVEGRDAAQVPITLYSDIVPSVTSGAPISTTRDLPETITVRVVDPDLAGLTVGVVEPPPFYSLEAIATFGDASVPMKQSVSASGEFALTYPISLDSLPALGSLFLAPAAAFGDVSVVFPEVTIPIKLMRRDSFPTITSVSASNIHEDALGTLTVMVDGPADGTGSVSLRDVRVLRAPASDADGSVSFKEGESIAVASGESGRIETTIDPSFEANGVLALEIDLELTSRDGEVQREIVQVDVNMTKPFDLINFLAMLLGMLAIFALVQVGIAWPAARYMARVRALPITTRHIETPIVISNIGRIEVPGGSLARIIADHRSIGRAVGASLESVIAGFTYRGFVGLAFRSLFSPRRLPTYVKRAPGDRGEITVGHQGVELVKGAPWGRVKPQLVDTWAVSFAVVDLLRWKTNPNHSVSGHLVYFFSPGSVGDGDVAARLQQSIESADLREAALKYAPTTSTTVPADPRPVGPVTQPDSRIWDR